MNIMWFDNFGGSIGSGIKSFSVNEDDVFLVGLGPNEVMRYRNHELATQYNSEYRFVLADRVTKARNGDGLTTMIRQELVVSREEFESREPNWGFYHSQKIRWLCTEGGRGYDAYITVPGHVTPMYPAGKILVGDFYMSGTSYFMVPESVGKEVGLSKDDYYI